MVAEVEKDHRLYSVDVVDALGIEFQLHYIEKFAMKPLYASDCVQVGGLHGVHHFGEGFAMIIRAKLKFLYSTKLSNPARCVQSAFPHQALSGRSRIEIARLAVTQSSTRGAISIRDRKSTRL